MHRCSWPLHEKEESVYVHFANFHFWIPLRSMALCQVRNIQSFIVPSCAGPLQPADWVFLPIVDLYNLAISVWVNIKVCSCVILNLHFCRLGAAVYLISFSCMNRINTFGFHGRCSDVKEPFYFMQNEEQKVVSFKAWMTLLLFFYLFFCLLLLVKWRATALIPFQARQFP